MFSAQDGVSSSQLFPINQPDPLPDTEPKSVEKFAKPSAVEEEKVVKKKKKKKEVQTMKIIKKDNKDELCMQEYEDLCYSPIRVDTIDMG
jgi:hypothetical protein